MKQELVFAEGSIDEVNAKLQNLHIDIGRIAD